MPSSTEWMISVLEGTQDAKVGAYPFLLGSSEHLMQYCNVWNMMKTDWHSGKLLSLTYYSCTLQACIEHAAVKHYMHHCNLLI